MASTTVPLHAHLVVDNCVLVMLHEYYCDRNSRRCPLPQLIRAIEQWMTDQLGLLRGLAPDGQLHSTDRVADEFLPGAGRLAQVRGIGPSECRRLAGRVRALLHCSSVGTNDISVLRGLPAAPQKLVGPRGLSDADLSLVVAALQLTAQGNPVYVLTNDQDLLSFISWLRPNREARQRWADIGELQGLHGLTYLDLVHRSCRISTDQMQDLVLFCLAEHYSRTDIAGTNKGNSILFQLLGAQKGLTESALIKIAGQGVAA